MESMEVEESKPTEPSGVSWFEFLLDESLLERHLKANADSVATDLIAVFMYQVNIATNTAKEIINKEAASKPNNSNESGNVADARPPVGNIENKKIKSLKLLALKVACHLRWNLDILAANLPLAIQQTLLYELISVVTGRGHASSRDTPTSLDLNSIYLPDVDLSSLTAEQMFAVLLYHQWCLKMKVQDSFPKKTTKSSNIQVPGLLDPNTMFANMKDGIMKMVKENSDKSLAVLEKYLSMTDLESDSYLLMPSIGCFGKITNGSPEVHDWSVGLRVEAAEMILQMGGFVEVKPGTKRRITYHKPDTVYTEQTSFAVGMVHFSQFDFKNAFEAFSRCTAAVKKTTNPVMVDVDRPKLQGYMAACTSLVQSAHQELALSSSLYSRVIASVRNNFKDLTALLIEDLVKQELSTSYRVSLEEKTRSAGRSDSLYEEVLVCNCLRNCLRGSSNVHELMTTLNRTVGLSDFFIKVCLGIHKSISPDQREHLKLLIRHLCYNLQTNEDFIQKILHCELSSLFSADEKSSLSKIIVNELPNVVIDISSKYSIPAEEESIQLADCERELLVTYDVSVIRNLTRTLVNKIGNLQTIFLSDTWRLPYEVHQLVESLHLPESHLTSFVHVLIAKSRICVKLQHYDQAKVLLQAADNTVSGVSYKLSRVLGWEMLAVDLHQYSDTGSFNSDSQLSDLIKRAKTCIVSMHMEPDIQPSMEVLCLIVTFLLNCSEFEYLAGLSNAVGIPYLHFGQIVSLLCKELPMINRARSAARELIDSVHLSFRPATEVRKPAGMLMPGGQQSGEILSQELMSGFVCKIKEPMVLSVFVSCFTKLLSLSRDDISEEIFSDYTSLWPTNLAGTKLDQVCITEMVGSLMHHALSVDPLNPSCLRTQADLHYVQGQFWLAIKNYLHVGVIATDFFSDVITKNVYDDQVYKRMIRCCTNLGCHTQAAVLCQMYDETDYTVAFKSLQERITNDSMDTYYKFIWDITVLEYLINLHARRGEVTKRQYVMQLIGQLELNSSNRSEILQEAARVRKAQFFRALARQYLGVELLANY